MDHTATWVNELHLIIPTRQAGARIIYPEGIEGWVCSSGWLYTRCKRHAAYDFCRYAFRQKLIKFSANVYNGDV